MSVTTPSGATTTRPADAVRLTVLLATGIPAWSAMAPPADWPQVRVIPNRPLRSGRDPMGYLGTPDVALATPRLLLRRFRAGDAAEFAGYRSDPAVARYQSWSAPVSGAQAAALVNAFAAGDPRQPGWFQYAIERTADRRLAGDLGVRLYDNLLQAEVGVTVAAAYQRRG